MKHKEYFYVIIFLILCVFYTNAQNQGKWKIYQLDNLSFEKKNTFLNTPTITSTVETTVKNSFFKASKYDRVLFVVEGEGAVVFNNQKINIKIGDILFVKANDTIKFNSKLKLLTWVSKSVNTNNNVKTQVFYEDFITKERDINENIWNRFINNSTMSLGLYMLPKSLGGDSTLNHEVDEINFVVNGTAKFKMNNTVIDVKPGSIMWVKRNVDHYFYNLSEDFDVYILFEKTKKK